MVAVAVSTYLLKYLAIFPTFDFRFVLAMTVEIIIIIIIGVVVAVLHDIVGVSFNSVKNHQCVKYYVCPKSQL